MSRKLKIASHVCRTLVGLIFVFSGFVKAVDPWGTALKVNEYLSIYGMEQLSGVSMVFSIWLCGAELMMGLMLLFKVRTRLVSIFALASMIFFTVLTFLSATWIPVEDCGCFGDALKLTPWETFAKNLIILPMVFVVWYRYRGRPVFEFQAFGDTAYGAVLRHCDGYRNILLLHASADRLPAIQEGGQYLRDDIRTARYGCRDNVG